MKISLCLIVWNELRGCQVDFPNLPLHDFEEVYVVDGGSDDGTVEYFEERGIQVYKQPKKGLNAAYVHANSKSTCDAVVVYFPKGTLPPADLLKFRSIFESGVDLVIASRQISGSINEEDSNFFRPRKWAVYLLSRIASLIWRREGYRIRDVLHGFKGWRCSEFNRMRILDFGLSIDIEMVIRSYKLKIRRAEFPTIEFERNYGETHFKILPTGKRLLKYLYFELMRKD